jgi:hypothetical protein
MLCQRTLFAKELGGFVILSSMHGSFDSKDFACNPGSNQASISHVYANNTDLALKFVIAKAFFKHGMIRSGDKHI